MTDSGSDDLLEGTDYRILDPSRPIGEGGIARVYKAIKLPTGEYVAVKVLRRELAHEHQKKRARREDSRLTELTALRHPHIVARLDSGETRSGLPFIVMELLEGETLADLLDREGPMPLEHAIRFVCDILRGLDAIHQLGLVHRDLKLENIFVDYRHSWFGWAKILDFGLAKDIRVEAADATALTAQGTALGTPRFMSPEQAQGVAVDHRGDLYAVGWILFSLVTGHLPFDQLTEDHDLMLAHAIRDPDPPSRVRAGISGEIDDFVLKALGKEPDERFQSAREMARALNVAVDARVARQPQRIAAPQALAVSPNRPHVQAKTLSAQKGSSGRSNAMRNASIRAVALFAIFMATAASVVAGFAWFAGRSGR